MDRVAELEAKVDALTKELDETKQLTVNLYRLFSENPAKVEQKVMAFFEKYAVKNGPISCLCCGKEVSDPTVWHAELPGIVICTACKSATYKVDALMQDAKRLDWIEESSASIYVHKGLGRIEVEWPNKHSFVFTKSESLRDALDSAMAERS